MTSFYSPQITCEVAFNAGIRTPVASRTWTDVSDYVELDQGITIVVGRGDELSETQPNMLSLAVDNSDGRFSPSLAAGAYYPNVKVGRPIRVRATYPPQPAANLLSAADADFESGVGAWTAGGSVPPTLSSSSVRAYSGTKSLLVTWGTGGTFPLAQVTLAGLTVSQVYTWSAYVWVPTGSPHVQLAVGGGVGLIGSATTVKDQWVRLSGTFTATATSHGMQVWPSTAPTAGNTVYVDAAMAVKGSELGDFNTVAQTTTTRFEGYVDEWPTEWPDDVDSFAVAKITASSRMARVAAQGAMLSMVEETILNLGPIAYYTMGEASGAVQAADSSGTGGDPLVRRGSGADPVFGSATGVGTDGLTAAQLTAGGESLSDAASGTLASGACVSFFYSTAAGSGPHTHPAQALGITFTTNGGCDAFTGNLTGAPANAGTSVNDGNTHHVALRWSGTTLYIYIDGVSMGSAATSGNLTINSTVVNAEYVSGSGTFTICHLALFDYDIGGAAIAAISEAGLTGGDQEAASARLTRLAGYAGIESARLNIDAAATMPIAFFDPSGASPLEAMRKVEATEGGVLYDHRDGTTTYTSRSARYSAASAVSLSMLSHEVDPPTPVFDRATMLNDVTATTSDGKTVRAVDDTSVTDYDPATGTVELQSTSEVEASAAAWWRVNTYGNPKTRIPNLGFEVTQLTAAKASAALGLTVGSLVSVTDWPAQVAAVTDFFVEGYTEQIGLEYHHLTCNVSPGDIWLTTFVLDSATRGVLDTNRLAY